MSSSGRKRPPSSYRVEQLEPRLLLAADWAMGLAPVWNPDADDGAAETELAAFLADAALTDTAVPDATTDSAPDLPAAMDLGAMASLQTGRTELVVLDAGVENYDQLLADLRARSNDDVHYDVRVIAAGTDGVAALSSILQEYANLDAVHLISHGSAGGLQLGDSRLDSTNIDQYQDLIRAWSGALADDADLLFYGCDFASTADGRAFANSLAELTGADVAASTDTTGQAVLGGDWDLEYQTGAIDSSLAFSAAIDSTWAGLLAQTFVVNTLADTVDVTPGDGFALDASGNTSLRAAIMEANAFPGADTIALGAGTYSLSIAGVGEDGGATGDLDVIQDLTIIGDGAGSTVIDGDAIDRVFDIRAGNVVIHSLTIEDGLETADGGAGLRVLSGADLELSRVDVSNNSAGGRVGGALLNSGTVTITDSSLTGNDGADGGAIANLFGATLDVEDSTVSGNSAAGGWGGGLTNEGVATITNSTFNGNDAQRGGAMQNFGGGADLTVVNSTISGNMATLNGGGLDFFSGAVAIANSTFTGNTAVGDGGGIRHGNGAHTLPISNTIVAGNMAAVGNDVAGSVVSDGSNIILDGTGSSGFAVGEIGVDPLLDVLADNGGPTQTHALLAGSPAIDSVDVNAGAAPSVDQRGAMRDGQADIGAYEFAATVPVDTDGDGLFDTEEDINADADNDPSTNPGPDTDGDSAPNYLDADDDGDGTPTSAENADPNADGDPRDAIDSDHDGQPDYLDLPTTASDGTVDSEQKISDTAGGLTATLADDDNFGRSVAGIGDLNGDGVNDIAVGAHRDNDGGPNQGAMHILLLNADGTVSAEQKISSTSGGLSAALDDGDHFGRSVSGIGDLDGDGVTDLVVGANRDDDGGTNRGSVYVLFMNADGTVRAEQKISDTAGGLVATLGDGDLFGVATTGIGDLDGDGVNDIAVGAPQAESGGTDRGAVHILFLNADGTVKAEQTISSTSGGLIATISDDDRFGAAVTNLGDLDNDGITDIAVGAHNDDDGGPDRGAVHILFLNADGTVKGEQKISSLSGGLPATLADNDSFGVAVTGIGDLNADGVVDLAVGATLDDDGGANQGAVHLLFLNPDGTVNSEQKISSTTGGLAASIDDEDQFGIAIASLGDLNGDGSIDIAVGAHNDDDGGPDRGAVHILKLATNNSEEVLATNNALTVNEGASATITTALLETTDAEQATTNLIYTLTTTVSSGSLLLSGTPLAVNGTFTQDDIDNNRVTYVHNGGETTTDSFDLTVDDGFGTTTSDTFSITVQPANDGIAGTDGTITTYTDTAYTFSAEDFGPTDLVEGDNLLAVIITTAPDAGVLTNGVTTLVGGETVTAAQIAAGDLVFLPGAGASGDGYASFTFQVQDDGGTANGGIDTDPTPNTITIDVAPATFWLNTEGNSDPSDTNLDAWNRGDVVSFGENASLGETTTSGAFTYQFTLTMDDGGTPVDADLRALHYVTRTITVGSGADTFTLLEGDVIGALKLPDDDSVTLTSTNTLMVTRKDVFVFRPDMADDYASGTFTMLLEDPVAENIHAISLVETTTELGTSGLDLAAGSFLIAHSSPGDHDDVFQYTATTVGSGSTAGAKTLLLDGSTLGFSEQVQGLEFLEAATTIGDTVVAAGQLLVTVDESTTVATLTVAPQDVVSLLVTDTEVGGGTAATATILFDGSDVALSDVPEVFDGLTLAVGTGPANTAPSGADGSVNILEDEAHTFALTDFGFSDTVDGDDLLAVTVATLPGSGTLTNNGSAVSAGERISALDIANNLFVYTPVPDANGVPSTSFTFQVQDDGGTAKGGADLDASPNTLTINITAVNDAPSFSTLGDQAVDEDSGLNTVAGFATALPGGGADEAAQTFSYTVANDNTGLFAVGPAIDANGQLTYTLAANAVGTATVTVSVTDSGGTTNGGDDTSPDQTFDIVVAPINDEPSFSTLGDQSVDEDSGLNTVAGFATALPGGGADESGQIFSYAVSNNNAALFAVGPAVDGNGQLTYTLNANVNGTATVTLLVKDSGGTANGGDDTSPDQTFDIIVAPVNDEPSFSTLGDQRVDEDSGLNTVAGFATALPGGGADESSQTFSYSVGNNNAGLFAVGPAIDANGELTYTLAADANGSATVTVSVTDSGGTTNGGDDTSPDQTFDIIVAPVNDAPSFSTLGDQTVIEDSGVNTVAGFATALPGGGADEAGQSFAFAVSNNNAGLFAVGPAIDASGQLTYTLNTGVFGTATATVSVKDNGGTGNGGSDTSPTQTFDIVVDQKLPGLWFSSDADVPSPSDAPGLDAWTDSEVVSFGQPGFNLEPGTTAGVLTSVFDIDLFTADTNVDALHHVASDITIGTGTTIDLKSGDVLFSLDDDVTLTSANTVTITRSDIVAFRPTVSGDYSSGTFTVVLEDPTGSGVEAFTLVEESIVVGNKLLDAGTFLLAEKDSNDIQYYTPGSVGQTTTAGGLNALLVDGSDIGMSKHITGIDVVENNTVVGGVTLDAGTILLSVAGEEELGSTALSVTRNDVFLLDITKTTLVSGIAEASATLLLDGIDVGLDSHQEAFDALTLVPGSATPADVAAPFLVTNTGGTALEGGSTSLTTALLRYDDALQAPASVTFVITTAPADGQLEFTADPGTAISTFTQADVNAGLVRYVHNDTAVDPDGFEFLVHDGQGNSLAGQTFGIAVTAVNDEPSFSTLGDQSVDEDSGLNTVAGFATALPGGGADEAGQTFTYAVANDNTALFAAGPAIDANGQLTYTLAANANGTATVTVSVTDSGGTANGGDNTSPDQTFDIVVTPVNDEPSFSTLGDQSVDEDSGLNTVAGFATALPGGGADEAGQTFTYAVANDNAALFAVGPAIDANGQLTYTLAANATGTATVTVSVTDSGGTANGGDNTSPDQTFDIVVTPVNDEPSFSTLGDQSVDEDSGLNTVAGFATALPGGGADEAGQTFTYAVANDNTALFAAGPAIDANGQLTYTLAANANGTATVTVSVTDSGGTSNGGDNTSPDQTFDIIVAPVNDEPSFSTLGDQSVDEDSGLNTVASFATALPGGGADEAGQTFTYAVANDNAGLFAVGPAIDANGQLTYTLAADAVGTATVTVSVTDSGGTANGGDNTSPDQTFDIVVAPINDEPSFSALGDQSVDEDSGLNTVAGFATALPGGGADEAGQTFTYAVANDNAGLFAAGPAIDANGQLTYTLAANANGTATVTVSVTDSGGTANGGDNTSPDQSFDIIVAPVNDEPSFSTLGDQSVDEDSGLNTVAGFATALPGGGADEAGQTFTYAVANDNAALFAVGPAIDANGQLTYTLAANAVGTATVTVSVTDSGGTANGGDNTSPDQTFDILVAPINDEPSFSTLGDQSVDEDSGLNTVAGFATALPGGGADEAGQTFTYAVANDNTVLFAAGPAIDANGQLTYTLAANANGTATVTVSVTDSGGTSNGGDNTSPDQTFDIIVAPVNDEPSLSLLGDQAVDEDSGLNTVAGFASALPGGGADEAGQNLSYTVSNNNAALFAVGPALNASGQLTYTLNANVNGTATVTVSVKDSGGTANGGDDTSPDQTFDIVVAPINDEPSFSTLGDQSVDEDSGLNTVAGFATALPGGGADEAGQTFIYTVADDNAALFAVGPAIDANGQLTYTLNANVNGTATVTLSVTDSGGTSNGGDNTSPDQTFDIIVAPVNDEPSFSTLGDQSVDEDSGLNTVAGFATALPGGGADETGQTFIYTVANDNAALFAVGPAIDANGQLTYTLNANVNGTATVTVSVTDSGGTTNGGDNTSPDQTFDIIVAPINDEPSFSTLGDQSVDEDSGLNTVAGFATALPGGGADEASQTFTYAVANDNTGLFAVGPAIDGNGQLTYTLAANATGTATVTVSVTDSGGTSNGGDNTSPDQTFDIIVAPVNDKPSFSTLGNQSVAEDSGLNTVAGFATALPGGGADETGQTFIYTVANDNAALFAVGPAIDTNGQLTYTLNANVNGTATVTVSVKDSGGTANGGDDTSPDQTFDIIVAPVNDQPSFSTLGDQGVDEDSGLNTVAGFAAALPGGGADEATQTFSYTVSNDNTGLFAVGPAIDATGQLTYTLAADATGTATVTVSVSDSGGTSNGGDNTSPNQTFDIVVAPINDEPSFSILGDQAVEQDSLLNTIAGFATALPGGGTDESAQTFSYSVSNDNGSLFAVGPAIDANGQLTYTLAANAVGTATVTVSVTDSGGTSNGGDDTSPDQTFDILVAPINDEPSFSTLGDQNVDEDSGLNTVASFATASPGGGADEAGQTFTYAVANDNTELFAVGPAIDANGQLTYTLAANAVGTATVTVSVTDSGGTANGGDDTSPDQTFDIIVAPVNDEPSFSILGDQNVDEDSGLNTVAGFATALPGGGADEAGQTFTYAVANNNAALFAVGPAIDATGQLTYTLAADATGTATVRVSVTDSGGTANGGNDTSPEQSFDIIVAPVADPPAFALLGDQSVDEDSGAITVIGFALPGGSDNTAVAADYSVTHDNAALFAVAPTIASDGTLAYTPADNAFGTAKVVVSLLDPDAMPLASASFSITVKPVNDAPTGADASLVTLGNTPIVFTVDQFGFSDPVDGDALIGIQITAVPTAGSLEVNGSAVSVGDTVKAEDITAGKLRYIPPVGDNTSIPVGFSYRVQDAGGTESGGTDLAPTSNRITIQGSTFGSTQDTTPVDPGSSGTSNTSQAAKEPAGEEASDEPAQDAQVQTATDTVADPDAVSRDLSATIADDAILAQQFEVSGIFQTISAATRDTGGPAQQDTSAAALLRALLPEALDLGQVRDPWNLGITQDDRPEFTATRSAIQLGIDAVRNAADEEKIAREINFNQSTGAVLTLSVGYLSWLLRGGVLLTSVLSSLPAWRFIDPLPVFAAVGAKRGDDDNESLEDIVEGAPKLDPASTPAQPVSTSTEDQQP